MSKEFSANIHDPNHAVDEYDIYFNGEPIETGGDAEVLEQFIGGYGAPINEGRTLRVGLSTSLNDVNAEITAHSITDGNISSTPKIIGIKLRSAFIADSAHGLYQGSALTFTVIDNRTIDIGIGSNTALFTSNMQVFFLASTY